MGRKKEAQSSHKFGRAKCFNSQLATLDLVAGYWQVKVQPDNQERTTFSYHMHIVIY